MAKRHYLLFPGMKTRGADNKRERKLYERYLSSGLVSLNAYGRACTYMRAQTDMKTLQAGPGSVH